jgi:hypothetical protein
MAERTIEKKNSMKRVYANNCPNFDQCKNEGSTKGFESHHTIGACPLPSKVTNNQKPPTASLSSASSQSTTYVSQEPSGSPNGSRLTTYLPSESSRSPTASPAAKIFLMERFGLLKETVKKQTIMIKSKSKEFVKIIDNVLFKTGGQTEPSSTSTLIQNGTGTNESSLTESENEFLEESTPKHSNQFLEHSVVGRFRIHKF